MKNKTYFYILLFFIWLPFLNKYICYRAIHSLEGNVVLREKPSLNKTTWFSGKYQEDFENYINDNIGGRPFFVRVKNQIYYSLFDIIKANGIVDGKDNFLYEKSYIDAYYGKDFLGKDTLHSTVLKIQKLQSLLEKQNKTLIICLAPSKARLYPEFFPSDFLDKETDKTNYDYYKDDLKKEKINFIDFNSLFLKLKKSKCDCPIYPKYGIYWSEYTSGTLATDSLIKYIEAKRNIDMPNLIVASTEKSLTPIGQDFDIGASMNLLVDLKITTPMCYAKIKWDSDKKLVKPKVLTIGDSYYWGIFITGVPTRSFSLGGFWYYNNQVYSTSNQKFDTTVDKLDLKKQISKNDVIVIMATEPNLSKLGWGFIDNAIKVLQ
ncbi:alginate O-acetyltransferase AlgX-related protein [Flavobacterium psychrophilum]|uniref:alginate O-acetyltransferase AlgX-related protein n=1 Tax=Flavobacterium psychrophilum TaxID=96345 RepID=UPI000A3C4CCC|nr:hypothetical protein [Flavobacterium psychrophilum]OUD20673.1 hypothetical protein FPG48_04810 [Flavobacterium psychrophilum]